MIEAELIRNAETSIISGIVNSKSPDESVLQISP